MVEHDGPDNDLDDGDLDDSDLDDSGLNDGDLDDEGLGEAAGPDFAAPAVDRSGGAGRSGPDAGWGLGPDGPGAGGPSHGSSAGVTPGGGAGTGVTSTPPGPGPESGAGPYPTHPSNRRPTDAARPTADPAPSTPAVPAAWAFLRGPGAGGPAPRWWRGLALRLLAPAVGALVALVAGSIVLFHVLAPGAPAGARPGGPIGAPFSPLPAQPMAAEHFGFTSPDGWGRADDWGRGNDAALIDRAGNTIRVYSWQGADAADRCERELSSLQIWVPGEISSVPTRKVGGRSAPGGTLAGTDSVYVLRCVAYQGLVFNMSSKAEPDDVDAVASAYASVLDSWKWT